MANNFLLRRGNVLYFRIAVPAKIRPILGKAELCQSLRTQDTKQAIPAAYKLAGDAFSLFNTIDALMNESSPIDDILAKIHTLITEEKPKPDKQSLRGLIAKKQFELRQQEYVEHLENEYLNQDAKIKTSIDDAVQKTKADLVDKFSVNPPTKKASKSPKLSVVIDDFIERYDKSNRAMYAKIVSIAPILLEIVSDKQINQLLQGDINKFFDTVQKLPPNRTAAKYKGMSIAEIIKKNEKEKGICIAEKTFRHAYKPVVSIFLDWAMVNYSDQGFPTLSVKGAVYRGNRANGIHKQRAFTGEELKTLFTNNLMKEYASEAKTAHYCFLPLLGLYTGARINELAQLNPTLDILQDSKTGIHYLHFNEETETADDVIKSVKTKSSKRAVPIHSKLIELGFLKYVNKIKRQNSKVLFPQWKVYNGRASDDARKWFSKYLRDIKLFDPNDKNQIRGFHAFRHTFVTYAINNKIDGFEAITGHESTKISDVVAGYYTTAIVDKLQEKQEMIEKFIFNVDFYKPTL